MLDVKKAIKPYYWEWGSLSQNLFILLKTNKRLIAYLLLWFLTD
jgi:hypothetical protein